MSDQPSQNPVDRVLEAARRKGVELSITTFDESTHTAEEAATQVGAELGQIVKSLVFVAVGSDGTLDPILCLVSGANRVDLSRLAAAAGEREVRRATAKEAKELTGFTIGGIPPLGHLRPVRTFMDPDLGRYDVVWAAAGTQTSVFPVSPVALQSLAEATAALIAELPTPGGDAPGSGGSSASPDAPRS